MGGVVTSRDEVIALLAPALGEATATTAIDQAVASVRLPAQGGWSAPQRRAVLEHVAGQPGLIGITARVVLRRDRIGAEPSAASAPGPTRGGTKPWEAIADLLVPALGGDGARAAVERAIHELSLGRELTSDEALRVLDRVGLQPGVVGIAARFSKTRLHLLSW